MTDVVFPFQRPYEEVEASIDAFADAVIGTLESSFTAVPIGPGFVRYPLFELGYESLRQATDNFNRLTRVSVLEAVGRQAMAFVVVRTILGYTPGEWAHVASTETMKIPENWSKNLDKQIRTNPDNPLRVGERIRVMIDAAVDAMIEGAPDVSEGVIHRLDKADTRNGQASVVSSAKLGVPYAMLLYERLLGRPFATVRDANSERVGDIMELPIEERLTRSGIPFRKTQHAERLPEFEQAPDFIIPDEFSPKVVIEAKITEDAGTARDKATRIQHLHTLSRLREETGKPPFAVIACIDGRGFATRREDMKKIIRATEGRVFTLHTLNQMVMHSPLKAFATK